MVVPPPGVTGNGARGFGVSVFLSGRTLVAPGEAHDALRPAEDRVSVEALSSVRVPSASQAISPCIPAATKAR